MSLDPRMWWFLSRSSGITAWVVLTALTILGILLSSRMLRPVDRPAWLLAVHRWLGALFVVTVVVHMSALVLDSYVEFGAAELLVPMASSWRPGAVAFGILGLYYGMLVEVSSLLMRKLSRSVWRGIHYTSYVSYALVTVHAFAAGSDAMRLAVLVPMIALITAAVVLFALRLVPRGGRGRNAAGAVDTPEASR